MASRKAFEKNGVLLKIETLLKERSGELPCIRHRSQGWCAFIVLLPDSLGRTACMAEGQWRAINVKDCEVIHIGDRVRINDGRQGNILSFQAGKNLAPMATIRMDDDVDVEVLTERAFPI